MCHAGDKCKVTWTILLGLPLGLAFLVLPSVVWCGRSARSRYSSGHAHRGAPAQLGAGLRRVGALSGLRASHLGSERDLDSPNDGLGGSNEIPGR